MRYRWEAALVGVSAIWGWTFVVVQDAIELTPPFLFIAIRFAIAAVALAAFGAFRRLERADVARGAVAGLALFAGYAFQTVGLQYTTPSNAGFITGLFVILTPLIGALVLRRLPSRGTALGVVLATSGLALLASPSGFGRGDALMLGCAVSFAVHILLLGRLGPGRPAIALAGVQVAVASMLAATWTVAAERTGPGTDATVWWALAITGLGATAAAFLIQTRAQQVIPPTRTAVILSAEPVFAGIFGYALAGDRLGARGTAGAALIVAGILAAELLAPERESV